MEYTRQFSGENPIIYLVGNFGDIVNETSKYARNKRICPEKRIKKFWNITFLLRDSLCVFILFIFLDTFSFIESSTPADGTYCVILLKKFSIFLKFLWKIFQN